MWRSSDLLSPLGWSFWNCLLQRILQWEIWAPAPRGNVTCLLQPLEEIWLGAPFENRTSYPHLYIFDPCGAFFLTYTFSCAMLSCANHLITWSCSAPPFDSLCSWRPSFQCPAGRTWSLCLRFGGRQWKACWNKRQHLDFQGNWFLSRTRDLYRFDVFIPMMCLKETTGKNPSQIEMKLEVLSS